MDAAIIKHADGTLVTAQEAYDAFINTRVLIVVSGITHEAVSMEWYDNNSTHTDPTNVGYVELSYVTKDGAAVVIIETQAGNPSLVPTQQG